MENAAALPLDRSLIHVSREHRRRSMATAMWTVVLAGPFFSTVNGGAVPVLAEVANLSDFWYGLVQAISPLCMLIQIPGSLYVSTLPQRPATVFVSGFIGRLLWIPVAAVPLVLAPGVMSTAVFVALVALAWMGQHISGLTWQSLMGDLVPSRRRGKYFGARVRLFSAAQLLSTVVVACTLPKADAPHAKWILLATIAVAAAFGAYECYCYRGIYDPPRRPVVVKLSDLARPLRDETFRPFLLYGFLIASSNGILAPFLWRHLLKSLELHPFKVTLILQTAALVGTLMTAPLWGRWMDRHGTKAAMTLALICSQVFMLAWPFVTPGHWWLGFPVALITAGFWAGVDVSLSNRLFAHGSRGGAGYFAVFNAVLAVAGFASMTIGGAISQELMDAQWLKALAQRGAAYHVVINPYMILLACCLVLRLAALSWMSKQMPKDRPVPTVTAMRLMAYQMQEGITGVLLWPIRFVRRPWVWK